MKLSWFILCMAVSISSIANPGDSIAKIRKPVLSYLLFREKQARYLEEEVSLFKLKIKEKDTQLSAKDSIISAMKSDSLTQSKLLSTETNKTKDVQSSLEEVQEMRKEDKKIYRRRTIIIIGLAVLVILL